MYKIDIEYLVPEFAEIELEAADARAAELKGMDLFIKENPEAVDPVMVNVIKL